MDERLATATHLDGRQRFYPPGQHPATDRHRIALAKLEAWRDRFIETPQLKAAIAYHEEAIAAFEAGEDEAKRRYLQATGRE